MLTVRSQNVGLQKNPKPGEILLSIIYHTKCGIGRLVRFLNMRQVFIAGLTTLILFWLQERIFLQPCVNRISMPFMCCKVLWELIVIPQFLYTRHSLFLVVGLNEVIWKQQTWLNRGAEWVFLVYWVRIACNNLFSICPCTRAFPRIWFDYKILFFPDKKWNSKPFLYMN